MGKLLSAIVALVALGAGAALFFIGRPATSSGPARADLDALAASLDGAIRETAAGVHSRATTLAELPRLVAAVSTDAATLRDLTQDELAFRPKTNEVITIGQLPVKGGAVTLLELPEGAGRGVQLEKTGLHLLVREKSLYVSDVEKVTPRERAEELAGAVAVSWPVDLTAVKASANRLGIGARLTVAGAAITVGDKPVGEGALALPLTGNPTQEAALAITPPDAAPGGVSPLQIVGGAIALLGLLFAGLLFRRTSSAAATQPVAAERSLVVEPSLVVDARAATDPGQGAQPAKPQLPSRAHRLSAALPSSGRMIGRYDIIRPLGSGGMAEVFLARVTGEAGFEKLVALKVMHSFLAVQPIIVEHFLDEARLASILTHPNIVQITDLGKADDAYFIAMEYIEGADLHRLMQHCRQRGEKVPVQVALTIIRKICDGLHAAHTAVDGDGKDLQLVHRDVKAANVFIAKNGAVKVGDFGIAKANQASAVVKTEVGQVKGTVAYMAPEHRLGHTVDRRADLYAVGAIAYELLSGTEVNLDLIKLVTLGINGWPHLPPLEDARPGLPPGLEHIILKALAYERDQRYATCAEMEEAFEKIANQYGLIASDKAVAQWVADELAAMGAQGTSAGASRPRTG